MRAIITIQLLVLSNILISQEVDYSQFKGRDVKIDNPARLSDVHLYDYSDPRFVEGSNVFYVGSSRPEGLVSLNYDKAIGLFNDAKNEITEDDFIVLDYDIWQEYKEVPTRFVRYEVYLDSIKIATKVLEAQENLGKWTEVEISFLSPLKSVMEKLNLESFGLFRSDYKDKTIQL